MIRYTAEYHKEADNIAKEYGFEFAVYMGHFRDCLVFIPYDNDTLYLRDDGFHYISIGKEYACLHTKNLPPKGFPLDYDYLKKGRKLFRELEKKVHSFNLDDPDWQNDVDLYGCINGNQWGDLQVPKILKNDLCLFLQEGKRLGRKVVVKSKVEQHGGILVQGFDSECYYLKLE